MVRIFCIFILNMGYDLYIKQNLNVKANICIQIILLINLKAHNQEITIIIRRFEPV